MLYRRKKTTKSTTKKRGTNYVADMDRVFQYYIRLRDAMPGGFTRCISCGHIKPFDQMQAGHYYSRSHFSTRWNEDNVHGECCYCNCFNGDHLIKYRENLICKIGLAKVQYLDVLHNECKKWHDFEIIQMIKHYGEEVLRLSASKGIHITKDVQAIIKRYAKL